MSKADKTIQQVLCGTSDKNIAFADLCYLLDLLVFESRIKGDHHIYAREVIQEIINIQPKGNLAKVYQVKQVRTIILKYKLEV